MALEAGGRLSVPETNVPTERILKFPTVSFLYFLDLELQLGRNWSRILSCGKWTLRYLVLYLLSCARFESSFRQVRLQDVLWEASLVAIWQPSLPSLAGR
jgi:hypothetical protein